MLAPPRVSLLYIRPPLWVLVVKVHLPPTGQSYCLCRVSDSLVPRLFVGKKGLVTYPQVQTVYGYDVRRL